MKRHRPSEEVSINLTPMIDIVFLLIIFFMVSSKLDANGSGVQVTVPGTGELRSMSQQPDEKLVEVASDGSIRLEGETVTAEQLTATLRTWRESYPALQVAVRGEGNSSFQRVAEVMQRVSAAGVRQMGVAASGLKR